MTMNFRVGPYVYKVRQVEGLIPHEGQYCLGLCDNERHELLISDQASAAQQVQVVCHEYLEAWVYHFGQKIEDKEDYCDLFGMAMTQFVLDFIQSFRTEMAFTDRSIQDIVQLMEGSLSQRSDGCSVPSQGDLSDCSTVRREYMTPQTADESGWVLRIFEPLNGSHQGSAAS